MLQKALSQKSQYSRIEKPEVPSGSNRHQKALLVKYEFIIAVEAPDNKPISGSGRR